MVQLVAQLSCSTKCPRRQTQGQRAPRTLLGSGNRLCAVGLLYALVFVWFTGRRNEVATLAPLLWHSFATITTLLQETVSIYYKLSPPTLSMVESERVSYSLLLLLQFVVTHQGTRILFVMKANIGSYLYPFLSSVDKTRPSEHLRLTALGAIGTLVNVATYILQKILSDDEGLNYICVTADRFTTGYQCL